MILEEACKHVVNDILDFLVKLQLLPIQRDDHFDYELGQLRKRVVVVVLTDGKVDVAATHDILEQEAYLLHVLPL